jgi:hypothetical protein
LVWLSGRFHSSTLREKRRFVNLSRDNRMTNALSGDTATNKRGSHKSYPF